MKAFVLMCLVYAAEAAQYQWDPSLINNPPPKEGSECVIDKGSCRCCMMLQETNRLKSYFDNSLNNLEMEYSKTNETLHNIKASRSAFSVALNNHPSIKCFGPFNEDRLIIYKHVFINLGGGYNVDTGVFTVLHSGVYSLALTIYSDAGSPGKLLAACAGLLVNGQLVAGSRERNMLDQEDSATLVVVLLLTAGDLVAVNLPIGCFLCGDYSHYNTFSAFLLYPTV